MFWDRSETKVATIKEIIHIGNNLFLTFDEYRFTLAFPDIFKNKIANRMKIILHTVDEKIGESNVWGIENAKTLETIFYL